MLITYSSDNVPSTYVDLAITSIDLIIIIELIIIKMEIRTGLL